MNAARPTPETFLVEARLLLRSKASVPMNKIPERDFRAHFGVGVAVVSGFGSFVKMTLQ